MTTKFKIKEMMKDKEEELKLSKLKKNKLNKALK